MNKGKNSKVNTVNDSKVNKGNDSKVNKDNDSKVENDSQVNPVNGSNQGTTEKNQPTDRYSVKLDDFLVQEELDHEGNEEEHWETRTVRFVEEATSVNKNDTKRKRRP